MVQWLRGYIALGGGLGCVTHIGACIAPGREKLGLRQYFK